MQGGKADLKEEFYGKKKPCREVNLAAAGDRNARRSHRGANLSLVPQMQEGKIPREKVCGARIGLGNTLGRASELKGRKLTEGPLREERRGWGLRD